MSSPPSHAQNSFPADKKQSLDFSVFGRGPLDPNQPHEKDAVVQALYAEWSTHRPEPPDYDAARLRESSVLAISQSAWTTKAAAAWVLARQLHDDGFERYALGQLVQNCAAALFGPWAFIEARCPHGSPIRRFTNHWVAWNVSLNPEGRDSEFAGLYAALLAGQAVRGETRDPRTFDLDHWYNDCSDVLVPSCDHHPFLRAARQKEKLRSPAPPPTWGAFQETRRGGMPTSLPVTSAPAPAPNLASLHYSRPRAGRKRKWRVFSTCLFALSLIFGGLLAGFYIAAVVKRFPDLRVTNVYFTAAVVGLGLIQFFLTVARWRSRLFYSTGLLCICAICNGVTWAVDTKSCFEYHEGNQCASPAATAGFILSYIPLSILHVVAFREP
ncbi:hypothetical protein QBC34DRAFT_495104 [Podospora aff. communis PSN243]|uniref:Uncharacterized protein n=1 Tax=Podospora aff. communis PSN243 TaxID=3040156 RepID=A0AAV9GLC9_9PEZI|nr:hypothetical protein QBC34DRAFT_495104 [Podospora aff. communis PSN243]